MGSQIIESAQNIHASRGQCKTHANQFWWAPHLFSFRDIATLKWPNFTFKPWSSKNSINRNWLNKFMQVDIDVTFMYTNFGGHDPSGFGDTSTLKNGHIFLSDHGIVHGHQNFN